MSILKKTIRSLYSLIPLKRRIFEFVKRVWRPSEMIYKHLHFEEAFRVRVFENNSFLVHNGTSIENEIFWEGLTGRWEKESMKLWIDLAVLSTNIIDIGANNGIYSLVAKAANPLANVWAFEPHPVFFDALQRNISLNDFSIEAYNKAVSDVESIIEIEDYSVENQTLEVNSITLDSFVESRQLSNVDLMKIDVETFEPQVLNGFSKYLRKFRPNILIEVLSDDAASKINSIIEGMDYLKFNIDENKGVRLTKVLQKSDGFNYLLCQKEVVHKVDYLKKNAL